MLHVLIKMNDQCKPLLSKDVEEENQYTKYGTHECKSSRLQGWIPWLKSKYQKIISPRGELTIKDLQRELNYVIFALIVISLFNVFYVYMQMTC